jgi:arsenate reductase
MYLGYVIMEKSNILFLCSGNSARSQMAEALLRFHAGDYFEVYSAGLVPKGINPLTVQVMEEIGIAMDQHYSKSLNEYVGKLDFGYLITVCGNAEEKCPVFPGMGIRQHWGFDDPAAFQGSDEQKLDQFRHTRNLIETRILMWLSEMGIQAAR